MLPYNYFSKFNQKMSSLKQMRMMGNPLTGLNSSNAINQVKQSLIISRKGNTGNQLPKVQYQNNWIQSKYTNINMIQSQVVNNVPLNTGFFNSTGSNVSDRFVPNLKKSNVDPMKQSTMNYVRQFSKPLIMQNLMQDRLRQITKNFMRLYGTNEQITQNGIKTIQKEAHSNQSFDQNSQTIQNLFQILDANHDKKITQDDMLIAVRRYLNFNKKVIIYTPVVQERLNVARRLFKKFDVERKGFLTEKQVPNLLNQTYKCLGKTFVSTPEDVKSWMKLTDSDADGRVTLPEYQHSIIRALKKQGVRIYEQ